MVRVKKNKSGQRYTVFVHVQIPGREKPYRKSKTHATREKAKAWGDADERRVFDELAAGRFGRQPGAVPTLAEFAPRFVEEYVRANRHKASGVADKQSILEHHLLPAFGTRRLDEIDTPSVQRLKAKLAAAELKPKTVENIMSVLRKLLRVAVEWDVLEVMPCTVTRTKVAKKTAQFYDFAEFSRVVAAAEEAGRDSQLIVLLGGDAGLRLGEMRGLDWRDVKWDARRVVVERSVWRDIVNSTKGMRARSIPLTPRLHAVLSKYREAAGPVLRGDGTGGRMTHNQVRSRLRRVARVAGVTHGVHILRHTFCSHLAMRNASSKQIQVLAGHENLSTTEGYMHLAPGQAELAIALLDAPAPVVAGATGVQGPTA
jgi:integrase